MKGFLKYIVPVFFHFLVFGQPVDFVDISKNAGIDHIYDVYFNFFGGGVTILDYNNDGHEDFFVTGGERENSLYQNQGDGTFKNVAKVANLRNEGVISLGAISADVNKDGFIDLFVTTMAKKDAIGTSLSSNILYINMGDGTFADQTEKYALNKPNFSTAAAFGDINADGYPDLFVSNYFIDFDFNNPFNNLNTLNHFSITKEMKPGNIELYLNIEGKRFRNITHTLEGHLPGYGLGGVFTDFDNDSDLDLYIINDFGEVSHPNQLYENLSPEIKFVNSSKKYKVDYGLKAMGVAIGDSNNDGWLDYHITNIFAGPFALNRGNGLPFVNLAAHNGSGLNKISSFNNIEQTIIGWGTFFVDFDNDTDLDLFDANGPINPPVFPIPNVLFKNNGRVYEVHSRSGLDDYGIARGAVHFDFDNDGDQDILVINQTANTNVDVFGGQVKSKLYKNITKTDHNWIKVKLLGTESTTRGLGSRVHLYSDGLVMIREIDGGSSHASQNSTIAHFGLGENKHIDSLTVSWPGGKKQALYDVEPNQLIEVHENVNEPVSIFKRILNYFND